jgi:hypothetical protein
LDNKSIGQNKKEPKALILDKRKPAQWRVKGYRFVSIRKIKARVA